MGKIAIHGFYGCGNLGDESILKALLQEFCRISKIKVVVFSRDPQQIYVTHGVRSIHSQRRWSFLRRIWEIKTSDLFVLGGGGLLKDYGNDSSSLKRWLRLLQLAQRLNVKTALCAVGVENIRYDDSRRLLKNVLDKVDLITVRDNQSKDILKSIGVKGEVKVVADPSVLLADTNVREAKGLLMPPRVIICIRHWFDKGFYIKKPEVNENFIKSLSITADFLIEKYGATIEFIPMRAVSYDDDRIVAKEAASYMKYKDKTKIHSCVPDVDGFIEIARQSSLVIGMRLHSLILATAVGVPVIGLEYMPKVRAFMNSIDQSGYSLDLETITSDKLIRLIEKTFDKYDNRTQTIISKISKSQRISRDNITELTKFLAVR